MAPRNSPTLSKKHKEAIRQSVLARHAARKAAGLPSPAGKPYITPPDPPAPAETPSVPPVAVPKPVAAVTAPRVILRDDGTPVPPKPAPVVEPPPPVIVNPAPRRAFMAWLRGKDGRDASDTRMSTDAVRFGAELEDRLFIAFTAGLVAGAVPAEGGES